MQVVIPHMFRKEIMTALHGDIYSGHLGFDKTYSKIKTRFFWPGMHADIHIRSCIPCNSRKMQHIRSPMGETPLPGGPMDVIAVDTCQFPLTKRGNKYLIHFHCLYSSWPEVFPVKDKTAETVANLLATEIFPRHGAPRILLSDNGLKYDNKLLDRLTKLLGINGIKVAPYHPASNGANERWHRVLNSML
ncbi:PREDICTED: uncharacterized protein K02A2.6-like [Priapulus caudatus]|uniref:RNA-directed DNA polymerase n=1 Tax=Priapulus caudatus TaxID=37621 RepID=A0ABM1ENG4_PRICU|nr:PREDICTED: uncharacterized protein K02A2.6-like [Priapulus caudatus]